MNYISSPKSNYWLRDVLPSKVIPKQWKKLYFNSDDFEIEARFGELNQREFSRVKKFLDAEPITTQIEIFGDYRLLNNETWETKERLKWKRDDDYDIKFTVSKEIEINEPDDYRNYRSIVRQRKRYTKEFGSYKIELTEVLEDRDAKRELEVEYIFDPSDEDPVRSFLTGVSLAYKVMKGTDYIYSAKEHEKVKSDIKRLTNISELPDARDMNFNDFVWGGIIGNPDTTYTVTYKADGYRVLLFVNKIGIWLLNRSYDANLIWFFDIKDDVKGILGTILEGESLPKDSRLGVRDHDTEYEVWFYDALNIPGGSNILNRPHIQSVDDDVIGRLGYTKDMINMINLYMNQVNKTVLSCRIKTFKELRSVHEEIIMVADSAEKNNGIFDIIKRDALLAGYVDGENRLPYKNDGFIFTPTNSRYKSLIHPRSSKPPPITVEPSILKWKPENMLTIDFEIRKFGERIRLMMTDKGNIVPYANPSFDGFIQNSDFFDNISSGSVVEFGWNGETFEPIRIRDDRPGPNGKKTVDDIWRHIRDPITLDAITGNDMRLYRKYHNRVKRWLYGKVNGGILLDLGSGIGGDASSWGKFEKIYAVEPDDEKYDQFFERISDIRDKVELIEAGSEDYEIIGERMKGEKADVISAMFSLTFLWKNKETFDGLIRTINENLKPGGTFIFVVMDGEIVKQYKRTFNQNWFKKNLLNGEEYKVIIEDDGVTLDFPGTKTVPKEEPLTRLTDLVGGLKYEFEFFTLDSERLLPRVDSFLSRMYTAGIMKKPMEVRRIKPVKLERKRKPIKFHLNEYEVGEFDGKEFVPSEGRKPRYISSIIKLLQKGMSEYEGDFRNSNFKQNMEFDKEENFVYSGEGSFDLVHAERIGIIRNEDWRSFSE